MRLGCTVSTYPTKFGPIVFKEGNLADSFALMRKYDFSAVDMFVSKTSKETLEEYKRTLTAYDMHLATFIAIFLGENGVKLSETDPQKRLRNLDLVKEQLDNAAYLGGNGLAMGFIRGGYDPASETEADALKRIADALHVLGEYADSIGVKVLLEPINRYEINTLNKATDTADFIRQNHLKGVGMLLDCFHMNIEDKSLADSIRYAGDLATNLHISSSNRYAWGEGHLDVPDVLKALLDIDFKGNTVLECFSQDAEKTLKQTSAIAKEMEKQLGFRYEV